LVSLKPDIILTGAMPQTAAVLRETPSPCAQRAPMGCQNFLLPFLVTAKMRCVERALARSCARSAAVPETAVTGFDQKPGHRGPAAGLVSAIALAH
jgi:hypothetical protein